jgi:serine/threonine-protein kinase
VNDVPAAVDAIVMRGLSREPSERFASAQEMAQIIEATGAVAPTMQIRAWLEVAGAEPLRAQTERVSRSLRSDDVTIDMPGSADPVPLSLEARVPRSRMRVAVVGAVAAVLAVGTSAVLAAALVRSSAATRATARSTPSALAATAVSAPSADDGAHASAVVPSDLGTTAAPAAPPPLRAVASTATPPRRAPVAPLVSAGRQASSAAGRACAPVTLDEQGHKVFNPSCL